MSSILKALKKIEGRKVDATPPAWPYDGGSPAAVDRQIRRSRRWQKILGVLIVLCAGALAVKLHMGSRPEPEPTAVSESETATGNTSANSQKTVTAASRAPSTPSTLKPSDKTPPEAAAFQGTPATDSASEQMVASPAPETSGEATAIEAVPATPVPEAFGAPPTGNAGLTLLALVWSGQPDERFVVINGSIVREGGGIEGSTVVRIEEDYVVMRTGGVTWKFE